MDRLNIKVKLNGGVVPENATDGASGVDLRAMVTGYELKGVRCYNIGGSIVIKPGGRVLVKTGIHLEIPEGYEGQVRPRSGLALKKGISIPNTPGTIDADYRGDVGVILINHSKEDFVIENGDRIAQLVIMKVEKANFIVDTISNTNRGEGGFGSTGTK